MKGIILAGGNATRMGDISKVTTKQLLLVYNKPMIYYPLTTLIETGHTEIAVVCKDKDKALYESLLGDGKQFGISISYFIQNVPKGIAEAFVICKDFIGTNRVSLILGDNIFHTNLEKSFSEIKTNTTDGFVFGYSVKDPERFGVAVMRDDRLVKIEEKPRVPRSNIAITGLYSYPSDVVQKAMNLTPSARGEIEITDINNLYLKDKRLNLSMIPTGSAWLDTGTHDSLLDASLYVKTINSIQGIDFGNPYKYMKN